MGHDTVTPPTSCDISSAVTSGVNTELSSSLRRRYEGMNAYERRAMALDDVPAELRKRLSGTIPYAPQTRPRTPEEMEPLLELVKDEEDVPTVLKKTKKQTLSTTPIPFASRCASLWRMVF